MVFAMPVENDAISSSAYSNAEEALVHINRFLGAGSKEHRRLIDEYAAKGYRYQTILYAKFDKRFIGHTDSSENLLDNPILIVLGVPGQLACKRAFITRENINQLISEQGFSDPAHSSAVQAPPAARPGNSARDGRTCGR